MSTITNKIKMMEAGHYLIPCANCHKALHAPEITYWKVINKGTQDESYESYCSAECSLARDKQTRQYKYINNVTVLRRVA